MFIIMLNQKLNIKNVWMEVDSKVVHYLQKKSIKGLVQPAAWYLCISPNYNRHTAPRIKPVLEVVRAKLHSNGIYHIIHIVEKYTKIINNLGNKVRCKQRGSHIWPQTYYQWIMNFINCFRIQVKTRKLHQSWAPNLWNPVCVTQMCWIESWLNQSKLVLVCFFFFLFFFLLFSNLL